MLVFGEELPQDLIDPGAAHYRKGTYGGLRRKAKW